MQSFCFNTTPQIIFETGAAANLGSVCSSKFRGNVLFITDKGLRSLKLEEQAISSLEKSGFTVTIFDNVEADPKKQTVEAAIALALEKKVSGVIGFGGGSPLDVAKLTALIAGSGQNLDDAWGVGNATGSRLPLILIPTTAGTGSEVTPVAIITVADGEKRGVSSPLILPDVAVLDANLTLGLPAAITAATGVDAMVHAIEAYTSKNINNNPMSRMLACQALQLLGANIEKAVFEPSNKQARAQMLLGSCLAGMAFANSPVAAVHALAYPIGGTFHIPHGLSNALILCQVLRFNACDVSNGSVQAYSQLASHLFPNQNMGTSTIENSDAFISSISKLSKKLGLPERLRDVGIPQDALAQMAKDAMLQSRLLVNNPREMCEHDALAIYEAAW